MAHITSPRKLTEPTVTFNADHEKGTRTHTYVHPQLQLIVASIERTPASQRATVYLTSPEHGISVHQDLDELVAVARLRQHLEGLGFALTVHPLSD